MNNLKRFYCSKWFNMTFFIVLFFIPFMVYWKYFSNDMSLVSGDGLQFYSTKMLLNTSFAKGEFPLWNKYVENGVPYAADLSLCYYPVGIVLSFLPIKLFVYSYYAMHVAIGAFFTYMYLMKIGCKKYVAIMGALIYSLSIYIGGYRKSHTVIISSVVYVPVILYYVECFVKNKKTKYIFLCSIAMATQFMTGAIQNVLYTDIFLFFYIVYFMKKNGFGLKAGIKSLLILGATYLGMIAVQIVPTIQILHEYGKYASSEIGMNYFKSYSIAFRKLLIMLFPEMYGDVYQSFGGYFSSEFDVEIFIGVIALIFVTYGGIRVFNGKKDSKINFFLVSMMVIFIYAANAHIPFLANILYKIPVIGGFRGASRALFLFVYSGLVIFLVSVDNVTDEKEFKKFYKFCIKIVPTIIIVGVICAIAAKYYLFAPGCILEGQDYKQYLFRTFIPALSVLLLILFAMLIYKKYVINTKKITFKRYLSMFLVFVLLCTIVETYRFSSATQPASINEFTAENKVAKKIKNDIGNDKIWLALPFIDGGYSTLFTQNSNINADVMSLNSYQAFNNPALFRLLTGTEKIPFNSSGLLTGSLNAGINVKHQNDMLSMLGVKYIIDPFEFVGEDLSSYKIGQQVGEIYKNKEVYVDDGENELFVFSDEINIENNSVYEISFDIESEGKGQFNFDFYGGLDYDKPEQEKIVTMEKGTNRQTYFIHSGTPGDPLQQVCFRILSRGNPNFVVRNISITKRALTEIKNSYEPYIVDENIRIFKNKNVKDILFIQDKLKRVDNFEDMYRNSFVYDFVDTAYVEGVENRDFTDVSHEIKNIDFRTNNISADVKTDKEIFVNFSQNHFPGWKSYVDGQKTQLYLVNGLIQGTFVPEGEHLLEFRFEPDIIYICGVISVLTLLISIAFVVIDSSKTKGSILNKEN